MAQLPSPTRSGVSDASPSKVLSTVPTPPPGTVAQPTQMTGMPLQVGDLPPGTIAVRVVRNPFSNVVGQRVVLHKGEDALPGTTESDGRATFTGLAVGDVVYASTVVDGEALETARFRVSADGGVRVLLVAGAGAGPVDPTPIDPFGASSAAEPSSMAAAPPPVPALPPSTPARTMSPSDKRWLALGLFASAVALAAWFVVLRRPTSAARPLATPSMPLTDEALLIELGRLSRRSDGPPTALREELAKLVERREASRPDANETDATP